MPRREQRSRGPGRSRFRRRSVVAAPAIDPPSGRLHRPRRSQHPMASCFSHPAVPLAIACWFPSLRQRSLLVAASLLSAAPDLDAFGYFAGVPYEAWCGHRGCTHSLLCAGVVAALLTPWLAGRSGVPKARVAAFLFAAGASHGVVDMATDCLL